MDNKDKKTELTVKNNQFYSLFYKDTVFSVLHSKTEKIIAAIHLVISLVSDSEPIKGHIKKLLINLLSSVVGLKDNSSLHRESNILKIKNEIFEIVSALNICLMSGMISEMNISILRKELFGIVEILNSNLIKGKEDTFSVEDMPFIKDKFESDQSHKEIGDSKNMSYIEIEKQNIGGVDSGIKSNSGSKRKNARTSAILSLIKNKKEVSIKDITDSVNGCSEKTIQRDLVSLIKQGVLYRKGERRWSRYSLVI